MSISIVVGHLFDLEKFAKWCEKNKKIDTYFVKKIYDSPESRSSSYPTEDMPVHKTTDEYWYEMFTVYYTINIEKFQDALKFINPENSISLYRFPKDAICQEFYLVIGNEIKQYNGIKKESSISTENGYYDLEPILEPECYIIPNCNKGSMIKEEEICGSCLHHFRTIENACPKCNSEQRFDLVANTPEIPKFFSKFIFGNGIYIIPSYKD
jgi:hypothetical protein